MHTGPIRGFGRLRRGNNFTTTATLPRISRPKIPGPQLTTKKYKQNTRHPENFIIFEVILHVKFNPIIMKQLYVLLCLLLLSGACSDDDTPNPAIKFVSPDSDVKISQDGTSAAITATHHAGRFVLSMEKNFEATPESNRSWCTTVLSGDRLTV